VSCRPSHGVGAEKLGDTTLPAEITNGRHQYTFPYGDTTRAVLATISKGNGFPRRIKPGGTIYNACNKDKPKLDKASGVADWVSNDLRRTFVTSWVAIGLQLQVNGKYINYISGTQSGIDGLYQRHSFRVRCACEKTFIPRLPSALVLSTQQCLKREVEHGRRNI